MCFENCDYLLINPFMNTLKLTKNDFKKSKNYWLDYIGTTDVSNYAGHIEIE